MFGFWATALLCAWTLDANTRLQRIVVIVMKIDGFIRFFSLWTSGSIRPPTSFQYIIAICSAPRNREAYMNGKKYSHLFIRMVTRLMMWIGVRVSV